MMRLNGIGLTFLGIAPMDENNETTTTRWFTFLFLPILPLGRSRIRFLPHKGTGFSYVELGREPIVWREVALTYLFGWIIFPALIFWPLVLAVKEVWTGLNLPQMLYTPFIIFAIVWLIAAVWKLMDWHENRGRPINT
ncbi:MAG: hypothetical protein H6667_20540 [Ardenticatenaceae bacterium]|nr:hypothetical protein [Ardenticatenaceae bacterium]